MKNILFIVHSLERAGAETQIIDLVNHIDHKRFNIHLLSFSAVLDQLDRIEHSRVTYHHILRKHKFHLGFIPAISKVINDKHIDLVHCTIQFSLLVGWLAKLISKRSPVMIDVVHTTVNRGIKEEIFDKLIYQWLMRLCKKIIFVCNNQRLFWEGNYSFIKKKSAVIYNGVDETYFSPEPWHDAGVELREKLNIPEKACIIACIARFRKEKGHLLLIEALSRSKDNVYLLLAGDGDLRNNVEQLVKSKGLTNRVFFLGKLSEVRPVLAASNSTILASTAVETFSIAMLESMAMATPMIASDIGGMSEAIEDGITGWLVSPGNVDQLAAVISLISSDITIPEKAGNQARNKVIAQFSQASMTEQYEKIFDELLEKI